MVIKVGINGFGRIGRIVFRACLINPNIQLSAINDPAISVEYICYLIKFDSTHGKLKGDVSYIDNEIVIDDNHIKVFQEKLPASVPWHSAGVQYVVEASGMFTNHKKASGHLSNEGVKRVIVTAPSVDIPMIILGVNGDKLCPDTNIISCASSTLYCLAPIIKVLEDSFGVEEGFLTSIHAMTPSLKPLDGLCLRGAHWRDYRSIHQNIIPATTGACKALGKILPQLKDKLSGLAFRVPIVNVSVLDLTVRLKTNTTLEEIVKSVERASNTSLRNIITISKDESVSSDFIGESHSCVLDENSSIQLTPNFFKIICWYENEYSYACRVLDTITVSDNQITEFPKLKSDMTIIRDVSLNKLNTGQQTKCSKKVILDVCDKVKVNSKIVTSTSGETDVKINSKMSSLPHPLLINKPYAATTLTSQTNRDRNRNELFKIWNDISEHSKQNVKQNRRSFFESCVANAPELPQKVECNAQERLENVKKEFSKMVNITEDLLKKTHSNLYNNQTKDKITGVNNNNLSATDTSKKDEVYRTRRNQSANDECGDYKSCIELRNAYQLQNSCSGKEESVISRDKPNYSDNNIPKDSMRFRHTHTESEKELYITNVNKVPLKRLDIHTKKLENRTESGEFKQQLSKTTAHAGLSQCIQIQYFCNENEIKNITPVKNTNPDNETCNKLNTGIPKTLHASYEKIKTIENIVNKKGLECESNEENINIKVIEAELKKRNIILVGSSSDTCGVELRNIEEDENKICDLAKNISKEISLSHESVVGLANAPDITVTESEVTSRCLSCENTAGSISNNAGHERKYDIYEKLDSASASDSNNSFQINERTSQVIQIADVTKSLEDLGRLDKICRIIEISDDLSNKLFSALDDDIETELINKRWSFKDLCVRIKLDEFCNKVFGASDI